MSGSGGLLSCRRGCWSVRIDVELGVGERWFSRRRRRILCRRGERWASWTAADRHRKRRFRRKFVVSHHQKRLTTKARLYHELTANEDLHVSTKERDGSDSGRYSYLVVLMESIASQVSPSDPCDSGVPQPRTRAADSNADQ